MTDRTSLKVLGRLRRVRSHGSRMIEGPARARALSRTSRECVSASSPARREASSTRPHAGYDPKKEFKTDGPKPPARFCKSNKLAAHPCKYLHMSGTTKLCRNGLTVRSHSSCQNRCRRSGILRPPEPCITPSKLPREASDGVPFSQAGVRRIAAHGLPESGAPEKYPKPAGGGTRGPWPKGGNFLGIGEVPPRLP